MIRTPLMLALAAAVSLAGCKPHTIVAGGPDDSPDGGSNAVSTTPVALPPSITASKSYRCKSNALIYVDWMSDGSARVKKTRDEVGTPIAAGSADLTGDGKTSTITYKGESCSA